MQEELMREAIRLAKRAAKKNEVPVGAVILKKGKIIARAHNLKETRRNALLHAEMVAIKKASKKIGDWRLNECEMYVTLEPCPMCAGAIVNARMGKVYFGAHDEKWGCCGTLYNLTSEKRFNWQVDVVGGILGEECSALLTGYFKDKRAMHKKKG